MCLQLWWLVAAACVNGSGATALLPNRTLGQVHAHSGDALNGKADPDAGPRSRWRFFISQPSFSLRHALGPEYVGSQLVPDAVEDSIHVKDAILNAIAGSIFLFLALSIQWFNEERSAKIEVLLTRGLEDCKSVNADQLDAENRGRLIHVQGRAASKTAFSDPQFQDALVEGCLKLQSTLEVFEWVPTATFVKEAPGQPRHSTEWTTSHHDSSRFRQPSPQNPRLPAGLVLGTRTTASPGAGLGVFHLSEEMLSHFHSFEPALNRLPARVHAAGITFHANPQDGFFYGRPGFVGGGAAAKAELFKRHQVGDLRVRFLCTPESFATVVAVQCQKDKFETFVPYRVVAQAPCDDDRQERLKLVEEGDKTWREVRRDGTCCTGGVATCCCCPCNTLACLTSQEVVTEEIFYISDSMDPPEKPFLRAVARNPWLLWNWRLLGWLLTYSSLHFALPVLDNVFRGLGLERLPTFLSMLMLTLVMWAVVVAAAYACYRPSMGIKYCLFVAIIIGIPVIYNQMSSSS